jgi:very-short-patch-repair endonuclease
MRLPLVLAGLPPCVQYPVTIDGRSFRLDLAYPSARLGVEYDGRHHRTPEQALRDLERQALLTAAGWKIIRFTAAEVHQPHLMLARVRAERDRRQNALTQAPNGVSAF